MSRRCSHCNSNGHNSRTCSTKKSGGGGSGGLKLFGVRLTDGSSFKKSASMGSLSRSTVTVDSLDGYHSDDPDRVLAALRRSIFKRRGTPWTEEEHRQFLVGLEKCGKGHWLAISQGYVPSKTPSQVASHAQKYFIHQNNPTVPERRRPSLFDIIKPDMEIEQSSIPSAAIGTLIEKPLLPSSQEEDTRNSLPSLDLSLKPAFTPFPFNLWPPSAYSLEADGAGTSHGQNLSPEPVVHEGSIKEVVGVSELTLAEKATSETESSSF